jgi:hypothetical protein
MQNEYGTSTRPSSFGNHSKSKTRFENIGLTEALMGNKVLSLSRSLLNRKSHRPMTILGSKIM